MGPRCSCPVPFPTPCVEPALDAANTQSNAYWSATSDVAAPSFAWNVIFSYGDLLSFAKPYDGYVRAVRGGL